MRLIDADALKAMNGMKDDCADCDKLLRGKSRSCEYDRVYTLMDFCSWIDDTPTIEPERKKGRWLNHLGLPLSDFCSACAKDSPYNKHWDFCPNCGADMRGDAE